MKEDKQSAVITDWIQRDLETYDSSLQHDYRKEEQKLFSYVSILTNWTV